MMGDLAWRIRVTYAAGESGRRLGWVGPDVREKDPGWAACEISRPIDQVEFILPPGRILLRGMSEYIFFVEGVESMGGRFDIEAFYLCGHLPGRPLVDRWRVGNGDQIIRRDRLHYGREWGQGPVIGWKPGAPGHSLLSTFLRGAA